MSITTVDIVIQSIFLGFALLQLAQAYCNCGELTSCMTRAWQPCWTGKDQQAMVLGMQLFPVDVERSGCPYEWKRLRGLDPTYTHWKSIMNCQTKRKVCHASIPLDGGANDHRIRDTWGLRCSVQAERCQHIFGSSCAKFDANVHYAECWRGNAEIDETIWLALEAAWTCEAKKQQSAAELFTLLTSSGEQDPGLPA